MGLDRIFCAFRQCNRNPVQVFRVPLSITEFARFRVFLRCRSYHPLFTIIISLVKCF
nr:MAG TPA: hypothetical protein [Caudoviricetes sp.]